MAKKKSETPQKSGSGLWMALGGGCALLLLCVVCSGGGAGVWYWKNQPAKDVAKGPDADKGKTPIDKTKGPIDKIIDDVKAKNPILGTTALGKTPLSELDAETPVWDFTIRAPKGFKMTGNNVKMIGPGEGYMYQWMNQNPAGGGATINIEKVKHVNVQHPLQLYVNFGTRMKSDASDKYPFEVVHMPQAVEINGLSGARFWMLYPWSPEKVDLKVNYRYHLDDWANIFLGHCGGKTEDVARRNADLVDVSICTFKRK